MTTFADSSALVKLYADEAGCDEIRALSPVAVAQLARVEVPAALWRKHRLGELASQTAGLLTADFEADFFGTDETEPRFAVVSMTPELLDEAAAFCATRGLRAYDAIQLAGAVSVRRADPTCTSIAVVDRRLRDAAAAERFALIPATL